MVRHLPVLGNHADSCYAVTIPKTTPPGEYLLRVEQIYPSTGDTSEFFVNCAQINIIGPGGGELETL